MVQTLAAEVWETAGPRRTFSCLAADRPSIFLVRARTPFSIQYCIQPEQLIVVIKQCLNLYRLD
jgi:hypothetical protein